MMLKIVENQIITILGVKTYGKIKLNDIYQLHTFILLHCN